MTPPTAGEKCASNYVDGCLINYLHLNKTLMSSIVKEEANDLREQIYLYQQRQYIKTTPLNEEFCDRPKCTRNEVVLTEHGSGKECLGELPGRLWVPLIFFDVIPTMY